MKTVVRVATLLASRQADSSPSVAIFLEKVVMNAVERAPSAKRSRNMFGTRNAIRKASRFFPAPNNAANSTSRIKPRTRLERIARPTTPVARVLTRLFAGIAASFTDATEQRSGSLRKRNQGLGTGGGTEGGGGGVSTFRTRKRWYTNDATIRIMATPMKAPIR